MKIDLNMEHGKALIEERLDKFKANLNTCLRFKLHIHNMSDDTIAHLSLIKSERTIRSKLHREVLLKFGKLFNDNDLKILK